MLEMEKGQQRSACEDSPNLSFLSHFPRNSIPGNQTEAIWSISEWLPVAQGESRRPAVLVQSPSGQWPTWERVLHYHAGADGGSPWGYRVSWVFFSLVSGSVASEGLPVTLRLPALIADFSPPLSRWAPSPPMPRMTDSGRRG